MDRADQINERLLKSLRDQGIEVEVHDGWVALDETGPALRGAMQSEVDDHARVQLDVSVALPDGRLMIESHAAARLTEEEGLAAAYDKFLTNSLPAITSAFFAPSAPTDDQLEPWPIGDEKWDVHLGSMGLEIFPASEAAQIDPNSPPIAPPPGLADEVRKLVCARESDLASTSWVRVFFAFANGEPVAQEALWNGQLWPVAQQAISDLAWPKYEGFYALRLFLIVRQRHASSPAWPLDHRSTVKVVQRLVALAEQDPDASEDDLCEMLIDEGVDYAVAEAVAQFTPLGFAYLMFSQLELSSRYHIANSAGQVVGARLLTSEPAFVAAREVARALESASRPIVATLAARAGIFQAIQDAVQQGRPIPDLEIVVQADEGELADSAEGAAQAQPDAPAVEGSPAAETETPTSAKGSARPWWKLWGA